MKVEFPVFLDGRTVMISEEVDTEQALVEFLASMQELFGVTVCERNGQKSDAVKFRVRKDEEENKYYELYCYSGDKECFGSVKKFGVNKKGGGLFPKTKDKDNNWLPNNGWTRYNKETGKEE